MPHTPPRIAARRAPRGERRQSAALVVFWAIVLTAVVLACVPAAWWEPGSTRWVGTTVSGDRFARLSRGVNLSHWFAEAPNDSARLDVDGGYTTRADFRKIRDLGFRHVRLPFAPEPMFNEDDPERIEGVSLAALDRAIDAITAEGLAVVVDMHPSQGSRFKRGLEDDDEHVRRVARFWRALARHFSTRDPDLVFLEVMNESEVRNRERWQEVQSVLLHAMRQGAPRHTLIATGARWGSVKDLVRLEPVSDRNVVYDFHFYDPYEFTHQGATWAVARWRQFSALPYPSSVSRVVPALGGIGGTEAKVAALRYGRAGWNADRLAERLDDVARWADRHGVRVMCGEFGVYRGRAPRQDRVRWLHDVRSLLERGEFGWSVWDYTSAEFGIVDPASGARREVDREVARALGL